MDSLTPLPAAPAGILAEGDGEILASVIGQLADAQAFLAAGNVPVSAFATVSIYKFCGSEAEVGQIAAAIGLEARWNDDHSHYAAMHRFGREVKYEAVYIVKDEARDAAGAAGSDDEAPAEAGETVAA